MNHRRHPGPTLIIGHAQQAQEKHEKGVPTQINPWNTDVPVTAQPVASLKTNSKGAISVKITNGPAMNPDQERLRQEKRNSCQDRYEERSGQKQKSAESETLSHEQKMTNPHIYTLQVPTAIESQEGSEGKALRQPKVSQCSLPGHTRDPTEPPPPRSTSQGLHGRHRHDRGTRSARGGCSLGGAGTSVSTRPNQT